MNVNVCWSVVDVTVALSTLFGLKILAKLTTAVLDNSIFCDLLAPAENIPIALFILIFVLLKVKVTGVGVDETRE